MMNWMIFCTWTLPIIFLSAASMIQTWFICKLNKRLAMVESVKYWRDWLEAINAGTSPSDLAYMKEKGFLK